MPLYVTIGVIAPPNVLFNVPHKKDPWSANKLERRFPSLIKEFDGSSYDSVLTFFYKLNKAEKLYEFKDAEAEEEFAELLGVRILCEMEECEEEEVNVVALTPEQMQLHKENLAMIKEGREFLEKK
jgi:hypothetical protein